MLVEESLDVLAILLTASIAAASFTSSFKLVLRDAQPGARGSANL